MGDPKIPTDKKGGVHGGETPDEVYRRNLVGMVKNNNAIKDLRKKGGKRKNF